MLKTLTNIVDWGITDTMNSRQSASVRLTNLTCFIFFVFFGITSISVYLSYPDSKWVYPLRLPFFIFMLGFGVPPLLNSVHKPTLGRIVFVFHILISYVITFILFGRDSSMRAFILPISILIIMLFDNSEQSLQLFFLLVMGAILGWIEFLPQELYLTNVYIPLSSIGFFRIIVWVLAVSINLLIVGTAMRMVGASEERLRDLLVEANNQNDWLQDQDNQFKTNQEELLTMNEELMQQRERLEELIAERSTRLRYTEAQLLRQVEELAESEKELRKYAEEMQLTNERLAAAKAKLQNTLGREREANEELAKTIKELKSTQAQLTQAEKMASIGQLTAGIAHEINNPINFVYAGMDALQTNIEELLTWAHQNKNREDTESEYNELIDETRTLLKDIQVGAMRTFEIVKGLRNFSRLNNEEVSKTHIHDLLATTIILLRNQIKEHGVLTERDFDPVVPAISCFPSQLSQVFMNVIANAIQALEERKKSEPSDYQPTLHIKTRDEEEFVSVHIQDNGIGMSLETQKRLFEPFYTTKNVGQGTGLGMSISYGIIEKHQGTIYLESHVNEGSTFIIRLPKEVVLV